MMVIYLASLTRSILALHKLIDNKMGRVLLSCSNASMPVNKMWLWWAVTRSQVHHNFHVIVLVVMNSNSMFTGFIRKDVRPYLSHSRAGGLEESASASVPHDAEKLIEQNLILHETKCTAVLC
eukprot:scaffold119279_cov18-Tisochrysis_lutea.AAC.1